MINLFDDYEQGNGDNWKGMMKLNIEKIVVDTNLGLQQNELSIIQVDPEGYEAWCGIFTGKYTSCSFVNICTRTNQPHHCILYKRLWYAHVCKHWRYVSTDIFRVNLGM